jgi:hypothetical protein
MLRATRLATRAPVRPSAVPPVPDPARAAFPVPPYLPPAARTLVPWARRYAATTARRSAISLTDAWDEALTALIRAATYFKPGAGTFTHYARTAVVRGLWRYCRRPPHPPTVDVTDAAVQRTLVAPSAEDEAAARDAVRASILREHAALATTRGDLLTAHQLRAAAATAARTARTARAAHPTRRA